MTPATDEFIRRFLIHVLPRGFHRIRHYGLLSSSARKDSLAQAHRLLGVAAQLMVTEPDQPPETAHRAHAEAFARWRQPRAPPTSSVCIRETAP